jgi:rRNA-processing protein FCF1
MKFLLDTNFLVLPFTKKIDIFSKLRRFSSRVSISTLSSCLKELKRVKPPLHKPALDLLKTKKVRIIRSSGDVDNALLRYSVAKKAVLCTLDRNLKQKALKKGLSIISVRGKRLEIKR